MEFKLPPLGSRSGTRALENLLWWFGWRPPVALLLSCLAGSVLFVSTTSPLLTIVAIVLPWAVCLGGAMCINARWTGCLDDAKSVTAADGAKKLGIDPSEQVSAYALVSEGSERSALVEPPKLYSFTHLFVAGSFVGIYDGSGYDFVNRQVRLGTGTKQLPFRQIKSVEYTSPYIRVRTRADEWLRYEADPVVGQAAVSVVRRNLPFV